MGSAQRRSRSWQLPDQRPCSLLARSPPGATEATQVSVRLHYRRRAGGESQGEGIGETTAVRGRKARNGGVWPATRGEGVDVVTVAVTGVGAGRQVGPGPSCSSFHLLGSSLALPCLIVLDASFAPLTAALRSKSAMRHGWHRPGGEGPVERIYSSGWSSPSIVGISSVTVGWMCTARWMTVYGASAYITSKTA